MTHVLEARIMTGCAKNKDVFNPRIPLIPTDVPYQFERLQFPIRLSFAMTINKTQSQSLKVAGVHLQTPWSTLCCVFKSWCEQEFNHFCSIWQNNQYWYMVYMVKQPTIYGKTTNNQNQYNVVYAHNRFDFHQLSTTKRVTNSVQTSFGKIDRP